MPVKGIIFLFLVGIFIWVFYNGPIYDYFENLFSNKSDEKENDSDSTHKK